MKDLARHTALQILNLIDTENAYSNLTLNKEINQANRSHTFDSRDRGLVTELVYGVLRMRGHLDYIINQFSRRPTTELDSKVRTLLRMGVYQIKFLDKIPTRAAVHSTVELAKTEHHQGIVKFINGVLRNIDRGLAEIQFPNKDTQPVQYISTFYSHPEWLVQRWIERFGVEETIEICKINNQIPDLIIRTNTLKVNPATLANDLAELHGLDVFLLPYPYEGLLLENPSGFSELAEFQNGLFTVQGQASMLVAHALHPEPGMKVADLCAAPGGKTTHLAALMENQGEILAIDVHPHKLKLIESTCHQLGVEIVKTMCADTSMLELEHNQFDRVLIDAPCSGLGLLAQKPEIRWLKSPEEIAELVNLQRKLLQKGMDWLKPGGILVYSTCTLIEEENQGVIEELLHQSNVELLDLRHLLPAEEREIWQENGLDTPYLEFIPHISETEGFFIAAIRKL